MVFELYRGIFVILPASLVSVPHPRNANIMGRGSTGFDDDNECWEKKDSRFEDPIRNKGEEREELLEGNMETPLLKNQ